MPNRPRSKDELMSCDLLVFSSHKTATQTVVRSLRANGFNALHGHTLKNIGLKRGELAPFLRDYHEARGRKIKVISIFRDPMDRLVSSFFQVMSAKGYAKALFPKFWTLSDRMLSMIFSNFVTIYDGYGESLDILVRETGIDHRDLSFDPQKMTGGAGMQDHYDLYLYRFDQIVKNWDLLSEATGGSRLDMTDNNRSEQKKYYDTYKRFKDAYRISPRVIARVFEKRAPLVDLFYPGQRQDMLEAALRQHGA